MADKTTWFKGNEVKLVDNGDGTFSLAITDPRRGCTSSAMTVRPATTPTYSVGDVVGMDPASNMVFENIGNVKGTNLMITGVKMVVSGASPMSLPSGIGSFKLHLFSQAPTAIVDDAAFSIASADKNSYLGYITLPAPVDMGDVLWSQDSQLNFDVKLHNDSTTLYGILTTDAAYTATSAASKTITLYAMGV